MSATLIQILIHFDYVYSELVLAAYTRFYDTFLCLLSFIEAGRHYAIVSKAIVFLGSRSHYSHASFDNRQIKYSELQCFSRQSPT